MKKSLIILAAVLGLAGCVQPEKLPNRSAVSSHDVDSRPIKVGQVGETEVFAMCASNRIIYVSSTGDIAASDIFCS